jgi:hypothetical protein
LPVSIGWCRISRTPCGCRSNRSPRGFLREFRSRGRASSPLPARPVRRPPCGAAAPVDDPRSRARACISSW